MRLFSPSIYSSVACRSLSLISFAFCPSVYVCIDYPFTNCFQISFEHICCISSYIQLMLTKEQKRTFQLLRIYSMGLIWIRVHVCIFFNVQTLLIFHRVSVCTLYHPLLRLPVYSFAHHSSGLQFSFLFGSFPFHSVAFGMFGWFIDPAAYIAHIILHSLFHGIWCKYHIDNNSVNMFGELSFECQKQLQLQTEQREGEERGKEQEPRTRARTHIHSVYMRFSLNYYDEPIYLCYALRFVILAAEGSN